MEFTRTFNYIHCLNLFRCVINSFYGVNRLNLLLGLSKRYGNETVKTNNLKKYIKLFTLNCITNQVLPKRCQIFCFQGRITLMAVWNDSYLLDDIGPAPLRVLS